MLSGINIWVTTLGCIRPNKWIANYEKYLECLVEGEGDWVVPLFKILGFVGEQNKCTVPIKVVF